MNYGNIIHILVCMRLDYSKCLKWPERGERGFVVHGNVCSWKLVIVADVYTSPSYSTEASEMK